MAVANSLAHRQTKTGLTAYLTQDAVKRQINSVVGGKNGTRFISSIVSAVQTTPAIQECTNQSILSAALLGEALNLSPSPQLGQFYIMSIDLQTAIDKDMAVIQTDGTPEYVENQPDEVDVAVEQEYQEAGQPKPEALGDATHEVLQNPEQPETSVEEEFFNFQ